MNKIAGSAILLLLCCSFASCSFHRLVAGKRAKSVDSTSVAQTVDTTHPAASVPSATAAGASDRVRDSMIVPVSDSVLLAKREMMDEATQLWKNRLSYKTFSGKAKMHLEGPEDKQEFTAHFRLRKDSVIWIAITGLGGMVPVARILITPDSILFVNQLHKEVSRMPLSQAAKILPTAVDFATLQNFVVGEPLREGKITDANNSGATWVVQVEDTAYIQRITYNKKDSTIVTDQMLTRNAAGPQAMTEFGGYEQTRAGRLSTARVVNIQKGKDVYMLDMNFQKTEFDEPLDYSFSIPKSYTVKQR